MELILNHTTLFYYNISSTSTKMRKAEQGPVASWVDQVSYQIISKLYNIVFFGQVTTAAATDAKRSRLLPRTVSSKTVSVGCRTNTSNAVVISSKGKIQDQDSNHHQAEHLHGFLEEDEYEERKAALSSPIKGRKRLSSAVKYTLVYFDHFPTNFIPGYCQS